MLELYTTWSPACQRVAPVFADLSRNYGCDKLKFGKGSSCYNSPRYNEISVDVGRNQEIAQKFKLRIDSLSQQVPTIALMKDGECVEIRPEVSAKGKLTKFHFSEGKGRQIIKIGCHRLISLKHFQTYSKDNIVREFHLNQVYTKVNGGATTSAEEKKKNQEKRPLENNHSLFIGGFEVRT